MRKLFNCLTGLVAIVLLSSVSVSCSKDEKNENKIVGKWQSTSITYTEYEVDKLVYEESETCIEWYIGLNLKSDGTGQIIEYEDGSSSTGQITWVIMSDKLMVTAANESKTETFDIVEIGRNSMTLSITEEYTENGVKHTDIETIYFKKL